MATESPETRSRINPPTKPLRIGAWRSPSSDDSLHSLAARAAKSRLSRAKAMARDFRSALRACRRGQIDGSAHARQRHLDAVGQRERESLVELEAERPIERLARQGGHQGQPVESRGARRGLAPVVQPPTQPAAGP